jgi:hypothetical protein
VMGQGFRKEGRHFGKFPCGMFLPYVSESTACWFVCGFCFGGSSI